MSINVPGHSSTNSNNSKNRPDISVEVKPGDNIWTLSERIYGKRNHPLAAIFEENQLSVTVSERHGKRTFVAPVLHPGQELHFPCPERIPQLQAEFFSHLQPGATKSGAHTDSKSTSDRPAGGDGNPSLYIPPVLPNVVGIPENDRIPQLPIANSPEASGTPRKGQHSIRDVPITDQTPPAQNTRTSKPPEPASNLAQPDLATRIGHVGEVVADGLIVGTVREGIKQSCQDPLGTLARAGTAIALGTAFGIATGGVGFVAEAAGAAAIGLTVAGAWDFLNPFDKNNIERNDHIHSNLRRAWAAPNGASMDACDLAMEKELGRPGFDFALSTLGGVTGAKFGRAFVPPPVVGSPPGPTGTSLVRLSTSTEIARRPLSTTIVPSDLMSDLGQNEHIDIVDAVSVKELPGPIPSGTPLLPGPIGSDGPKLLEDLSAKTEGGGGCDNDAIPGRSRWDGH